MPVTFPELSTAIFRAIAIALGLSPNSPVASSMIFRAYDPKPIPHSDPDEDLCFYHLSLEPGSFYEQEIRPETEKWRVVRLIPACLILTLYGTHANENAIRLSSNLFIDGHARPLFLLRSVGIHLIPPDRPPSSSWEDDGKTWRRRADLSLRLRIKDASDTPFAPIAVPPDIECVNGDGSV